jgi:hypothetical protein
LGKCHEKLRQDSSELYGRAILRGRASIPIERDADDDWRQPLRHSTIEFCLGAVLQSLLQLLPELWAPQLLRSVLGMFA